MTPIESNCAPSARERKTLAVGLCALGVVVASMILFHPTSLLVIAFVAGIAWCLSLLFNRDDPLDEQWRGALVPLVASLLYVAARLIDTRGTAVASVVAFVALGTLVWCRSAFGIRFYQAWINAFLPAAWSFSTIVLGLIYYAVITLIGLIMRLLGRDPLHRKFDGDATSYWVKRKAEDDPDRYFHQF
jgi:hypothetical protein